MTWEILIMKIRRKEYIYIFGKYACKWNKEITGIMSVGMIELWMIIDSFCFYALWSFSKMTYNVNPNYSKELKNVL